MTTIPRRFSLPLLAGTLTMLWLFAPRTASAQNILRVGETVNGELASGDLKLDDNTYADLWRFNGRQGQKVRITMRSSAFDAYLSAGYEDGGKWSSLDSDDDGGGGHDAQLDLTLPRDGELVVRANTLAAGETGAYTITCADLGSGDASAPKSGVAAALEGKLGGQPGSGQGVPVTLGVVMKGELGPGDPVTGDGTYADIYTYQGQRGEVLTMTQRSSAFDSYLTFGPYVNGAWSWTDSNDDAAGGKDSRLTITLPADGEYWIRPNTLGKATGAYTLLVESDRSGRSAPVARAARPAIRTGQTVRGELTTADEQNSFDDTLIDTYVISGRQGQKLTVIMLSPDFGSYLLVGHAPDSGDQGDFTSIGTKGASAGKEVKLTVELPSDGDYWIRANSFGRHTGSYVLSVE